MKRGVFLAIAALAFLPSVRAQTTFASITGVITDPNGSIIPGATVTATRTENNYKYTAQSNEAGYYTIAQLLEGDYEIKVESAGFKVYLARALKLANQQVFRLDVQLELGSVTNQHRAERRWNTDQDGKRPHQ
jgi:hypothetical protein